MTPQRSFENHYPAEAYLMSLLRLQRNRIEELESLLGVHVELPPEMRMTPSQTEIFGMLMKREGVCTKEAIYTACYGGRPECDQPEMKIIDVQICKIRRIVKQRCDDLEIEPIEIGTKWGAGYYIDEKNKARFTAIGVR